MVNLLHLCEVMTNCWLEESELRVPFDVFKKFAKRNNFSLEKKSFDNGVVKYKLKRKKIPVYFISGEEESEFNFMDLADLHIGNKRFDARALRSRLQYALDNGIKMVFIAGDVFEGCTDSTTDYCYLEQIMLAYYIFRDYPLTYYVINGNHDYSFEQIGLPNPIMRLANMLQSEGVDFHYFDVYLMDFIICGVAKRVMHVERQDFNKKRIFAALKVKNFDEDGSLQVKYEDKEYPVRFFQVGHIHINVQMYYAKKKVFISQPGSFLKNEYSGERANIVHGRVIDTKVFMT